LKWTLWDFPSTAHNLNADKDALQHPLAEQQGTGLLTSKARQFNEKPDQPTR
jgi:hypothetical protein